MAQAPILARESVALRENPFLLHIVLDAQWGIGGMRAGGDTANASFLRQFYTGRGFQIYEGAYSRFHETVESVPSLLSMGEPAQISNEPAQSKYLPDLTHLPYFNQLRALGYDIHVRQSTYIDLCQSGAVSSCKSEPYNSLRNVAALEGSWMVRGVWVLRYAGELQSRVVRSVLGASDLWRRAVAGQGIRTLHDLNRALEDRDGVLLRRGNAVFVHVLLPHGPVDVDDQCRMLGYGGARIHPRDESPSRDAWQHVIEGWGAQSRCAHHLLAETFDIVDRRIGAEHSIVIVQGDHGWRMNKVVNVNEKLAAYTDAKLNNQFSTLLAVRRPGVAPSIISTATPVQDFVWDLAHHGFSGPVTSQWDHFVRKYPARSGLRPELRALSAEEMLWATANPS
jgi:hypothetical protein